MAGVAHCWKLGLVALAAAACSRGPVAQPSPAKPSPAPQLSERTATPPTVREPFAVVELFTSEGCSSCPRADQNLADLAAAAETHDSRVFTLSFHVDYWNGLGWRDPFSRRAYSRRQYSYSRSFGNGRVYTPQMIVNGRHELVGSRRTAARKLVNEALGQPARVGVGARVEHAGGQPVLRYRVTGAPRGSDIHLALVQREATRQVSRGENSGRTLRHANVVRAFETRQAAEGHWVVPVPSDLQGSAAVVVYVSDSDRAILGAERATLP